MIKKEVLDTIGGGSYGECTYDEIAEKSEKISQNNKSLSTRMQDTRRNTIVVQATHKPVADEIYEEMDQMRIDLGLALKHGTRGAKKSTTVNTPNPDILPNNTIQNPKSDGYCMAVTTGEGKQTFSLPMSYLVEDDMITHKEVVETKGEVEGKTANELEIEALEQMLGYAINEKYGYKEQIGTSINLMPLSIYMKLGLGDQKPAALRLLMADRIVKNTIGLLHYMLVKVKTFIFPTYSMILDCEVDFQVPIILGRPFIATCRAFVDMEKG
ncbi:uncharacterized protein LOC107025061 [Solanum pennellii]|uniref:Uncharacterized protein LOC107025061 n=1 Tax=Solanum pennellii TaxID=28526 RepID=A0ABM1H7C1_SOLPN|nr:uncharacterized protein LOC107025061 [Solanum pennellii]